MNRAFNKVVSFLAFFPQRCILLLNHLIDHGYPDAVETQSLPELLRVSGELKKRKTLRGDARKLRMQERPALYPEDTA